MKISIFSFNLLNLRKYLEEHGYPKYSADQIFLWVYKKFIFNIGEWGNVSKQLKEHLQDHFSFDLPNIVNSVKSQDGTIKFLLSLYDGKTIETVLIPGKAGRLTQCISSQVGCGMGCTFCHTGTMKLERNLDSSEFVGQVLALILWSKKNSEHSISNIVYMGQGEPLHNFKNTKVATEIFLEPKGLGFGQRKITISTSGLANVIEKLKDFPPVNIAISLHATNDEVRSKLMPINRVYDLKRLFKAIDSIPLKASRKITYEYLLIKDVNDRDKDIDELIKLLKNRKAKINLIPFNEYPESQFKRPTDEHIKRFNDKLIGAGLVSIIRFSKGDDILAACGQLKSKE